MVCPRVLVGLLLFSLFSTGVSGEEIDRENLSKIIQFIHTRYSPGQSYYTETSQFAVAINVPANQCRFTIDQNFLSGDDAEEVKRQLNEKNLYQGQNLIAATPISKLKIHSERALLMCDDNSQAVTPMKNLLNKDKNGCVVFYTYNSPCLASCLNQERDDNVRKMAEKMISKNKPVSTAVETCILKSLSMLTDHQGPKAFVFKRVFREDLKDQVREKLKAGLKEVAQKVPLYKCGTNSCVKCLSGNEITNDCLTENV